MEFELTEKFEKLKSNLISLGNVAVAFSGGVDSSFLLKVAHDVLGDRAIAINVCSALVSESEKSAAKNFCDSFDIPFYRIDFDVLAFDNIRKNPPDRCYHCKKEIFTLIKNEAESHGIKNILDGSNIDDEGDYRPGMKALSELGVISPLRDSGLSKSEIRLLSKELNLPTFDLPSAACLASRICYGEEITLEKLKKIDSAEKFLKSMGFSQVRVRLHDFNCDSISNRVETDLTHCNLARIEVVASEMEKIILLKHEIDLEFKKLGFDYITLDLAGYRTGSMNEVLRAVKNK